MWSWKTTWSKCHVILWVGAPHGLSHDPAKFGGHRHCGSGDIMFLVAKEENSRCSRFNPPLLFNF